MTIGDYGWCCADGHWLTYEELSQWTDENYLKEYERVYLNREAHSKRKVEDFWDE